MWHLLNLSMYISFIIEFAHDVNYSLYNPRVKIWNAVEKLIKLILGLINCHKHSLRIPFEILCGQWWWIFYWFNLIVKLNIQRSAFNHYLPNKQITITIISSKLIATSNVSNKLPHWTLEFQTLSCGFSYVMN